MKRFLSVAMVICLLLFIWAVPAVADGAKKSGLFTYELKGNGNAVITGFDWKANGKEDIYVPRQIDGYNVSEIGTYAFSNTEIDFDAPAIGTAVVVILPDTITVIGEKAFFCTNITAATIPASVQLIGSGAFAGCRNIKQHSVASGNNVYATIEGILYQKNNKELVSVPAGYPDIDEKTILIPDGITRIGDYAFAGLDFGGAVIPSTVTSIGKYSFYSTKIPKFSLINLVNVDEYAFYKAEIGTITGMEYATQIGDYAFAGATIENGWTFDAVETIGDYAFKGANFKFGPENKNSENNTILDIKLPASLQTIGIGSFQGFGNRFVNGWDIYIDMSETKIQTVPAYSFSDCSKNTVKIVLPETLKFIDEYAFSKIGFYKGFNSNFAPVEIIIPPSVEIIGAHAFESAGLTITFSDGSRLNEIGEYAFSSGCIFNDTAEIDLPEGVEKIGDKAFNTQYSLDVVSIPSSVTEIGDDVCDRAKTQLKVEAGSYAALYASENGYQVLTAGEEDTSWLNS